MTEERAKEREALVNAIATAEQELEELKQQAVSMNGQKKRKKKETQHSEDVGDVEGLSEEMNEAEITDEFEDMSSDEENDGDGDIV